MKKELEELKKKVELLKRLILLTDDSVSNEEVSDLQIKQWTKYIEVFPEEN